MAVIKLLATSTDAVFSVYVLAVVFSKSIIIGTFKVFRPSFFALLISMGICSTVGLNIFPDFINSISHLTDKDSTKHRDLVTT
ncbi:hypothetical protein D1872_260340 [compost metagenome]